MELRIVKKGEKELVVETRGETFTLTNLLREYLWKESKVSEAAQYKEHPYLAEPKVFVKVKEGSPLAALRSAARSALKDVKEFKEKFQKAIKDFGKEK